MRLKSISLVIAQIIMSSFVVYAQSGKGNYKPQEIQEYSENSIDAFGEKIVPSIILPGFVGSDQNIDTSTLYYPSFNLTLIENSQIEYNRQGLQNSQIYKFSSEVVKAKPAAPTKQAVAEEVVLLSPNVAENKLFVEARNNLSFTAIKDEVMITKVSVNGLDIPVTPSNVVEFSSAVDFKKGANKVVVRGEFENKNYFVREYNVTYGDPGDNVKNWNLLLSLGVGYDNNTNFVPVKAYASSELGNIYNIKERQKDYFWQASGLYYYQLTPNLFFYGGLVGVRYFKEINKEYNFSIANIGGGYRLGAAKLTVGAAGLQTNINKRYYLFSPEFSYDFNFSEDDHSGFIVGSTLTVRRLPDDLKGSGYSFYGKYNKIYPFEWLSLYYLQLIGGEESFGTLDSEFRYLQFVTGIALNKTNWSLKFDINYTERYYKEQKSAQIVINPQLRKDRILNPSLKYTYYLTSSFDIFSEVSPIIVYSNKNPTDKTTAIAGVDYVF